VSAVEPVRLRGDGIAPGDVVRVARGGAPLVLEPEAHACLAAGRDALDAALARGDAVYGASRGLGPRSSDVLSPAAAGREEAVVLGRVASVGPLLPEEVVRAALCVRIASLAGGGAGVSPRALDALASLLEHGPLPAVPSVGSIGMSDLVLLAHVVRPVMEHVELEPKDAIGLIGSNSLTVGWAALLIADAAAVLQRADEAAALSLEAYGGGLAPLDPRVNAARPAAGQEDAAARLRTLLAGSRLERPGAARRLQDPLSFRCLPSVHGAARAALIRAQEAVAVELRGSGDNPLVVVDGPAVLPTGNFHLGALALATSAMALALHGVAAASAARVAHLLDERSSGLPRCLSPAEGSTAGLAPLQKATSALVGEIRRLAAPVMLDAVDTAEGIEDLSAPAILAVRDTGTLVERLRLLLAIELICAAQAVELRGEGGLGEGTGRVLELVRTHVAPLVADRPTGPDVDALATALR
jgi:histidine ammonia-lyase